MLEVQEERPAATATATTAATAGNASGRKERAKERQEEGQDCSSPVATPNSGPRSTRAKATPTSTHTHSHTHTHTSSPHQHSTAPASVALGLTSMHSSNPKVRNSPSANTQRWENCTCSELFFETKVFLVLYCYMYIHVLQYESSLYFYSARMHLINQKWP